MSSGSGCWVQVPFLSLPLSARVSRLWEDWSEVFHLEEIRQVAWIASGGCLDLLHCLQQSLFILLWPQLTQNCCRLSLSQFFVVLTFQLFLWRFFLITIVSCQNPQLFLLESSAVLGFLSEVNFRYRSKSGSFLCCFSPIVSSFASFLQQHLKISIGNFRSFWEKSKFPISQKLPVATQRSRKRRKLRNSHTQKFSNRQKFHRHWLTTRKHTQLNKTPVGRRESLEIQILESEKC